MDANRVRKAAETAILRISDHERDQVVERLKAAYTANQITQEEFGKRSTAALKARTELQLRRLTWDLKPPTRDELAPSAQRELDRLTAKYMRETMQQYHRGVKVGTWRGIVWAAAYGLLATSFSLAIAIPSLSWMAILALPALVLLMIGCCIG